MGESVLSQHECYSLCDAIRVEKKEVVLKKMLATVLKDKEKIEDTIKELDRYKRDALQETREKSA
jgi:chromosome segregation ATPase